VRVSSDWNSKGTAKAKVCNFNHPTCFVHQQILGLQISVQNSPLVAEQDANHDLIFK